MRTSWQAAALVSQDMVAADALPCAAVIADEHVQGSSRQFADAGFRRGCYVNQIGPGASAASSTSTPRNSARGLVS